LGLSAALHDLIYFSCKTVFKRQDAGIKLREYFYEIPFQQLETRNAI
jgi:hypothetical protein